MNILRNMMVRCVENVVNTDVFLKSQIFDFFDMLVSTGTAWDLILEAFRVPGAAFLWSGGCWKYTAILLRWLAGLGGSQNPGTLPIGL